MKKHAVSVTLSPDNLLWLHARATMERARGLSAVLDQIVAEARTRHTGSPAAIRSVRGTAILDPSDPDLRTADAAVRALFRTGGDSSPLVVRGRRTRRG